VPTKEDWEILINYLGGSEIAGGKMKESGTAFWKLGENNFNLYASNESGFSALPAGHHYFDPIMGSMIGETADFWSSASPYLRNCGIHSRKQVL